MKKIYLDNLSKWESGVNKNKINWKNNIGHKVKFVYDNIKGEIEIVDYKNGYLTLLHNCKVVSMTTGNFSKCHLGELLGTVTKQYKYSIGDVINGLEILEQIRVKNGDNTGKGYRVKCIKDGYVHEKSENSLSRGSGCSVCINKKIIKGINDIATTHPEYVKYFINEKDAYKYSYASNKKVNLKCPNCGFNKNMCISDLTTNGIMCPKCSDGKSYPEKFVLNMLDQLNVEFETEYSPAWSENRRYDFYIPKLDYIIETHGKQHYNGGFVNIGGRALREEQENDKLKKQFAIENNIKHYIVLDCRKSDVEYIKNNILNSELNMVFDLARIDWLKCHEFACNSRVKEACDLWNGGVENITKISEIMKLSKGAVLKYINQGTELGWCNYNGKDVHIKSNRRNAMENSKKCKIVLDSKEVVYNSSRECLRKNEFSQKIFDKLVKSKEPFKPNPRYHKHLMHLEGMRIEYI